MLSFMQQLVIVSGLVLGSITDLKKREVPDWLNFALIGAGIGFGLLVSLWEHSLLPLWQSLAGLVLGILIGYIMFYAGQWGGGDAKMIMGLGALFGLSLSVSLSDLPVFLLFLVNTLFVGAVYGLFWALFLAVKQWKKFKKAFIIFIHQKEIIKVRMFVIFFVILLIVLVFVTPVLVVKIICATLAVIVFVLFYLWVLTKVVEKTCMVRQLPIAKLTEGDWVYEEVWVSRPYHPLVDELLARQKREYDEQLVYDTLLSWFRYFGLRSLERRRVARLAKKLKSRDELLYGVVAVLKKKFSVTKKVLENACTGSLQDLKKLDPTVVTFLKEKYAYDPHQRRIAGPKDLGLSKEQISELHRLSLKSIMVKEGIPFVPSFLIAYVATVTFGNWLVLLL